MPTWSTSAPALEERAIGAVELSSQDGPLSSCPPNRAPPRGVHISIWRRLPCADLEGPIARGELPLALDCAALLAEGSLLFAIRLISSSELRRPRHLDRRRAHPRARRR